MVVLKFGGTSVRDAHWIGRTLDIAVSRLHEAPVLISSAMAGVTDRILAIGETARGGDVEGARAAVKQLAEAHLRAAEEICPAAFTAIEPLITELETLIHGVALIRELSPRTSDAIVSLGERLSTTIIAAAATERGIPTTLLDSRALVVTDTNFTAAAPDMKHSYARIAAAVSPRAGHLYVAQGFIGATAAGITTTLGRGGSDFSATIFGAALGADRVEIWTDVDGIMSADPRVVPSARTVAEMTYAEAAELAYFGAKVVHPSTMVSAVEREIPVLVCNTGNPEGPQTRIVANSQRGGMCALAGRRGVTIVTVHSSRMLNSYGFLSRMFGVFERFRVSVDIIATSEVSVSVSVDQKQLPPAMAAALGELGQLTVEPDKAVISIVGQGVWSNADLIGAVFEAIGARSAVEMVSLGSSDTNLSLVIEETRLGDAMRALHARFFE